MEDEEDFVHEWTRYQVMLPDDEIDEDDEIDARIEAMEARKRRNTNRGGFFGTT